MIRLLCEQPWTEISYLLRGDEPVVAILPCGAIEAHGPHLPLNTDVIISEGMAWRSAAALEEKGYKAVVLPSLVYAPAEYAAAFSGTITIRPETAKAVLLDIGVSLKAQGFSCLCLVNSHFDPANVKMLRDTAAEIGDMGLGVAYPDFTRRKLAETLTDEFRSGACHAGQYETSLVLAEKPELVDQQKMSNLPDNPASLTAAFAAGKTTFEEAGGPEAYFGYPRQASAAEGERSFAIMAEAMVSAVEALSLDLPKHEAK